MATEATIQTLVGGSAGAKVLLFIENYGEGYASRIARTFGLSLSQITKQLTKFEGGGILVSRMVGTSRIYTWNPRDPALEGLRLLLRATLENGIPDDALRKYYREQQPPGLNGNSR